MQASQASTASTAASAPSSIVGKEDRSLKTLRLLRREAAQTPRPDPLFCSPPKRGRESATQLKVIRGVAPKRYNAGAMCARCARSSR
jgi:hypothetical protein